jgi:hypothetical protein
MIEPVGYLIVGLFGIGMGLAFFVADPEASTSRSLALFWVLLPRVAMIRFFSSAEALIVATGLEWGLRVMRAFAIGEVIFLVGAIRYHVVQGRRGQFLARFLSPQVLVYALCAGALA